MATTLSPPTRWDYLSRPQSQPAPERDQETYRPRPINESLPGGGAAKQPKPAVISSIIDSLGTFDKTATPRTVKPTTGGQARPYTADGGAEQNRTLLRSKTAPGPSVEAHGQAWKHGGEDQEDLAYVVRSSPLRTSRPPSSLAFPDQRRGQNPSTTVSPHLRPTSSASQRSGTSAGSREKNGGSRNKLSAESWVKSNGSNMDQDILPNPSLPSRVLRPAKKRPDVRPLDIDPTKMSRAEQIISKAVVPAMPSPKGRLFLTDNGANEDSEQPDTPPLMETSSLQPSVSSGIPAIYETAELAPSVSPEEHGHSVRMANKRNSIVDSIPVRTSSLRQNSISPNPGKKKEKKSRKSKSSNRHESVFKSSAKPIPDSKWADLGEDDETVKRIRQLRERRQSRLMESRSVSTPSALSDITSEVHKASSSSAVQSPYASEAAVAQRHAPLEAKSLGLAPATMSRSRGPSVDVKPSSRYTSLDEPRPPFARASTERRSQESSVRSMALDYSYTAAVNDLPNTGSKDVKLDGIQPGTPKGQWDRSQTVSPPSANHLRTSMEGRKRSMSFRRTPSKGENRFTPGIADGSFGLEWKTGRRKDLETVPDSDSFARRESTEFAVDEYLDADRFSKSIKHPETGRVITFSEVGDPDGAAVFVCVGMGLTRYIAGFFDELAFELRLRLITVDRPGVGASQSYPLQDQRGPLGWPDDVTAICDSLNISKFSVLAHSAGAVYALATALILPHMIVGEIHLLAPWIPPSQLEVFSHSGTSAVPAGALPRSQRILRILPAPFLKAANASFMSTASASLKPASRRSSGATKAEAVRPPELSPPLDSAGRGRPASRDVRALVHQRRESLLHMDQYMPDMRPNKTSTPVQERDGAESMKSIARKGSLALATSATPVETGLAFAAPALTAADYEEYARQERYSRRLTQRTWELATKDSNPAFDLLVCLERHRDIGFRYTDVQRDIIITHGSEDKRVPVNNVRWLAEQMNRRAAIAQSAIDIPNTDGGSSFVAACELRVLEGEGHGLMASPRVMGDVLTEIAGYWYPPLNGTGIENGSNPDHWR